MLKDAPKREVSIPRRYAKNKAGYHSGNADTRFQSLVGTLKTSQKPLNILMHGSVSIPRRYAKNDYVPLDRPASIFRFQSLVGTLKTPVIT